MWRTVQDLGLCISPLPAAPQEHPVVAGRPSGRHRWLVAAALVLFVVGSLLLLEATKAGEGGGAGGHPMSAADFGHVHGIDVNPADGRVHVATHRGVLQLSER